MITGKNPSVRLIKRIKGEIVFKHTIFYLKKVETQKCCHISDPTRTK